MDLETDLHALDGSTSRLGRVCSRRCGCEAGDDREDGAAAAIAGKSRRVPLGALMVEATIILCLFFHHALSLKILIYSECAVCATFLTDSFKAAGARTP